MTAIKGARTIVFLHNGTVELQNRLDEALWNSSSVPAFGEEFGTFVSVDECEDVLEWLVEHDVLTEADADSLAVDEDSLESEDENEDEDEDDDEYGEHDRHFMNWYP